MPINKLYLLYAEANQDVANEILTYFEGKPLNIVANVSSGELEHIIKEDPQVPIALLISDNFLRSIDAMERLSVIIQEPSENLLPVLIDGRKLREGTSDIYDNYPTRISTINEVMQYRDFWYEEWIRLRKRCNDATGEELEKLENQKSVAKRMSTNIGTFLRNINGLHPLSWDVFSEDDFAGLHPLMGGTEDAEEQEEKETEEPPLKVVEKEVAEIPLHNVEENELSEEENLEDSSHEELEEEVEDTSIEQEEESKVGEATSDNQQEETAPEHEEQNGVVLPEPLSIIKSSRSAPKLQTFDVKLAEPVEYVVPVAEVVEEVEEEVVEEPTPETEPPSDQLVEETLPIQEETEEKELVEEQPVVEAEEEEFKEPEALELTEEEEAEKEVPAPQEFSMRGFEGAEELDPEQVMEEQEVAEVNDVDVLFFMAEAEMEEGDEEMARSCFERILQLDPVNGRALLGLARLLNTHFEGEAARVEDLYKKALIVNEENPKLYYEFALLLKEEYHSLHRSSDLFQRALELDPKFDLAYMALAACQKELKQPELAKANYLQACVLNQEFQTADNDGRFGVHRASAVTESAESARGEEAEPEFKHPNADKVVMVTGASSGIGKAVAQLFAVNGYKVIVTGRRKERLEDLKSELADKFQIEMETLSFDVRSMENVKNALEQLPENWRNIDILINNAGLARGKSPIHEGNLEHWETMIDTNIKGLLYLSRAITPNMVERGKGFVINVGSVAGKEAYFNGNVYCATKAAVDMLTRTMRLDLYKHGIRVAAVHPGHVETEFALVRFDGDEEKAAMYGDFTPLKATDVAETIYYIATRPAHVNIQDVLMFSTQQASSNFVDQSGRKYE